MNAEERNMISGLFDRMRSYGAPEKDREAETLIAQNVRAMPDAPYMLVQSVLVQEHALQQAGQRIEELEARVAQLEAGGGRAQASGGGFLGGLFGGGRSTPSVPARPQPSNYAPPAQASSPWGRSAQQPMQAGGGGGGFMKTAMATAAGVAGGMILADSIRGMMNSGSSPFGSSSAKASEAGNTDMASNEPQYQDPSNNDPGNYDANQQDAGYDGGNDYGGGDSGGMDT
jgi:uncharacterized protein